MLLLWGRELHWRIPANKIITEKNILVYVAGTWKDKFK
jgi:hypothetical protein